MPQSGMRFQFHRRGSRCCHLSDVRLRGGHPPGRMMTGCGSAVFEETRYADCHQRNMISRFVYIPSEPLYEKTLTQKQSIHPIGYKSFEVDDLSAVLDWTENKD